MLGIAHALGEGGERMVLVAYGGNVSSTDDERARFLDTSDQLPDPAAGITAPKNKPRPTMHRVRQLLVSAIIIALFVFYIPPLTFLASLLSPNTIKKYLPGLYDLLRKNRRLEALVSTNLPSVVVIIGFNALLPLILEWTACLQGIKAASHFSLSYVVFQSSTIIPLQLLQLPVTFGRAFGRLTAKTPRQHAELNAPSLLYSGNIYPAASMVFILGVLYSIVTPLITVFTIIYFALAYLLLLSNLTLPLIAFTFWFQHYLSRTFTELSEYISLSSIAEINKPSLQPGTGKTQATLAPSAEIANTVANNGSTNDNSKKQLIEQQRNPIAALRSEALDGIDPSETVLSQKRYSTKDETLFIAQKDRHTDYREPPAAGYYYGILNTGRRRYGHPAIAGTLPDIWPPVCVDDDDEKDDNAQDQSVSQSDTAGLPADNSDRGSLTGVGSVLGRTRRQSRPHEAVVVSLRKRKSTLISSSSLSNVSVHNQRLSSQEADGSGISGLPASTSTSTDVAGKTSVTFPQRKQRQPQDTLDGSCEEPEHQHENPSQVWGASRSRLPSTAEQIEDEGKELMNHNILIPIPAMKTKKTKKTNPKRPRARLYAS
ncbi:uncharacterized protein FA14DRAFT_192586 [Meira miltonrushii]|uniref:CSC1/OSCA1-like 7TM region domain-containing protein n=1 Tax=Meira miltonrushii TaxID=1280837 RepID=A0A316V846_9BASI|nr:uncharacterized protein FA14DRAFT_192586 [Meira miltonrushii]PWN32373.1 hypothetical protein FA14DRAFT_192586 [Meira miltonrushii]